MADYSYVWLEVERDDIPDGMTVENFIAVIDGWVNPPDDYRTVYWTVTPSADDEELRWEAADTAWGLDTLDPITEALRAGGIPYLGYDGGHYDQWNSCEVGWKPGMEKEARRTLDVWGGVVMNENVYTRLIGRAARLSHTEEGTGNVLADNNIIVIGRFFTSNDPADW
jgi:hypothetical protein